ncbi:M48 family metallopeptidase [Flammeovirgaceae bacterium SG7u.111]|nr:M48 family metallopeptidase [Flammeovirgaceae bacterium SG7u.132]WPO37874.1 M48 family metallopeptidase [Flammeovirgaceae bacterium SG7u.111]
MKPKKYKRERVHFKGIHPSAWEHPADRAALNALQKVPGLDIAIKTFFGATTEKSLRLITLGSAVRVSKKQFPQIHEIYKEACKTLDFEKRPELYISQNPFFNAGAIGMDNPFIVVNSGLVDVMDDMEIMGVLGHELGHIKSGHVLYKTLLNFMVMISAFTLQIPLSGLAIAGIIAALKEWDRKSELSADRAALLTVQNPEVSVQMLMKMAGGRQLDQMDLGEFIAQAEEYNNSNTLLDNVYKFLNTVGLSHPMPVIRVLEVMNWVRNGDYEGILNGVYNKDASNDFKKDFSDASASYKEDFKSTFDPLFKDASDKAKDIFDGLFNKDREN